MVPDAAMGRGARRAGLTEPTSSPRPALPFVPEEFRSQLQTWYRAHARRLPWRGIRNPYGTWLSEIMLQQTRVATVIDRYEEFMRSFPTLEALAKAPEDEVLALWSGLGYYRRARMLHRGAQFVQRELGGKLPRKVGELRTLPGVGEYTAAAIASIAFGESVAVLDGNVERVLLRILGLAEDRSAKARARLAAVAQALVPEPAKRRNRSNPPGDHNQAMMELGATICLPRQPLCLQCPVVNFCRTRGEHPTAARDKPQSRVVAHLLALRKCGVLTEVLLIRRSRDASLMPNMLELPPLPMEAVTGREPALRLRHSITNTNYYVAIFAESAPGVAPPRGSAPRKSDWSDLEDAPQEDLQWMETDGASDALPLGQDVRLRPIPVLVDDAEFEDTADIAGSDVDARLTAPEGSLLAQVPESRADLEWTLTTRLRALPLTGLARKVLQRLGVMSVPKVQVD